MARTIDDLREVLFDTLQGLKDGTIDIDKAKTIADVGQTIINTAKVEVDYIKARGEEGPREKSSFMGKKHPFLVGHKST